MKSFRISDDSTTKYDDSKLQNGSQNGSFKKPAAGRGPEHALAITAGHDFTITQFISSSSELVRTRLVAKKARLDIVIARTREQQVGPVEPECNDALCIEKRREGRGEGKDKKSKKKGGERAGWWNQVGMKERVYRK